MASLLPTTKLMFLGSDGKPLVGGKLYTYDTGTNTPRSTFADAAGTILNTNPIILDSRGEALVFWNGSYRVKLADALDSVIWTVDSVSEVNISYRTGSNGSMIVPYGTTLQRDATPQLGYMRYNIDLDVFEGYTTSGWKALADFSSLTGVTSINGGPLAGFRNRIINGNFGVNQRAYTSGAAVGAGLYGHDRWKMAASGDTYTFSTTANVTTVTIPAGKVLQQVIEGLNLETGTYTLSWVGTAQGKIGAGSYGASGITGAITGGTNTTIEFGPGTVSKVQLEFGSVVTAFEQRPYGMELALCKRYYHVIRGGPGGADYRGVGMGLAHNSVNVTMDFMYPTPMRIGPTVSASTLACYDGSTLVTTSSINNYFAGTDSVYMTFIVNSGLVTGRCVDVHTGPVSTSFLALDAEM